MKRQPVKDVQIRSVGYDRRRGRLEIEFTWTDDVRQFYSRFAYRLPTMLSDMTRIAQSPHFNMPTPQQIDKAGIRTRLSCLGLSTFRVVKRAYWATGVIGPQAAATTRCAAGIAKGARVLQ